MVETLEKRAGDSEREAAKIAAEKREQAADYEV